MATLTAYATSTASVGAHWGDIANVLGAPDDVYATASPDRWDNDATTVFSALFSELASIPVSSVLNTATLNVQYKSSAYTGSEEFHMDAYLGASKLKDAYETVPNTSEHDLTVNLLAATAVTLEQLRDATFKAVIACYRGSATAATFSVDTVWVAVDYTPPAGGRRRRGLYTRHDGGIS